MGMPYITSFLWCLGIETGARLIAVLHLVASTGLMIYGAVFASNLSVLVGTVEDAEDHIYSTWYKIALSITFVSVCHILLAFTLLVGVYKQNTILVRIWIYVMCVLYVAALLFLIVANSMYGFSGSGSDIFVSFLEGLLFFGFMAYCIICVFSYYLMLRSSEEMDTPNKTDY